MATFDLVLRGGAVIDGTDAPARQADVGVVGDRIAAVGDLSAVDLAGIKLVLDVTGRFVTPGFIDPHGHSDGSLFVDGALASHLHQGFTTQLSGNCGDSLAPLTEVSLARAVAKLTSVPAERLGLRERGVVREGVFADLVVLDPTTVADAATYLEPARYPIGIEHVFVNGRPAIIDGAETGERPGRLLRRG